MAGTPSHRKAPALNLTVHQNTVAVKRSFQSCPNLTTPCPCSAPARVPQQAVADVFRQRHQYVAAGADCGQDRQRPGGAKAGSASGGPAHFKRGSTLGRGARLTLRPCSLFSSTALSMSLRYLLRLVSPTTSQG